MGAQASQQNKAEEDWKAGIFYRAEQQRGMLNYLSMLVLKTVIGQVKKKNNPCFTFDN